MSSERILRRANNVQIKTINKIPRLPKRARNAHKGDFGRVLVIGGSRGMIGAPSLAANAALRAGAGLVTIACPESIQIAAATLCPCATSIPLPETRNGRIDAARAAKVLREQDVLKDGAANAIAIGPGFGVGSRIENNAMIGLMQDCAGIAPLVIDADALNILSKTSVLKTRASNAWVKECVLTPHPGEMARLMGCTISEVQADREAVAAGFARLLQGGVAVLKGEKTVVTDGERVYVNRTGNPGMATGGTGDVLTGVIAALIGQGLGPFDAAVLGVYVHGLAGDLAAMQIGETSLISTDLLDYLPSAFQKKIGKG